MGGNKELEIDLRDLILWLLGYWYIFVLVIVIGGGVGLLISSQKNSAATGMTAEENIVAARAALTEFEAQDVEDTFNLFKTALSKQDELSAAISSERDIPETLVEEGNYWTYVSVNCHNKLNGLSGASRAYYNALKNSEDIPPAKTNPVKYVAIFAMLFAIITAMFFSAFYIFTPSVKTAHELSYVYDLVVLSGNNKTDEIISADISISMNNHSLKHLALVFSDETSKKASERMAALLKDLSVDVNIDTLNPLSSPSELQTLSSCDSAVIIATEKKTYRNIVKDQLDFCTRYDCDVLGGIMVNRSQCKV